MRRFRNTSAAVKDLELHGFWHRRLETLVITGMTIHDVHGVTTKAFWLSMCRQLDLPTSLVHQEGPAELLRHLMQRSPSARFSYCVEYHKDGSVLFRAPRVQEPEFEVPTQEGSTLQGGARNERHLDAPPCRGTSRWGDVPPCERATRLWERLLNGSGGTSQWIAYPLPIPRPSRN